MTERARRWQPHRLQSHQFVALVAAAALAALVQGNPAAAVGAGLPRRVERRRRHLEQLIHIQAARGQRDVGDVDDIDRHRRASGRSIRASRAHHLDVHRHQVGQRHILRGGVGRPFLAAISVCGEHEHGVRVGDVQLVAAVMVGGGGGDLVT